MQTDAEIIRAGREAEARRRGPATFVPLQNHPQHRGVVDADYVRPAPTEFPKMVYHPSGLTRVIASRAEQDALGSPWSETPTVRPPDWRAKLNEVRTKSGFLVLTHHVEFLKANQIEVATAKEAAEFLDTLSPAEQEQFFQDAELQAPAEAKKPKAKK